MILSEQLKPAIEIAIQAHDGQLDTHNHRPYIEHPFRVMNAGSTLQKKIIGVLHEIQYHDLARLQKYLSAYKQLTEIE